MERADVKVRALVSDEESSKLKKYQQLIIGKTDRWSLIKYEAIVTLCAWIPGALGLLLRARLYPLLLGHVGKGVVFGTNVSLRHPHKITIGDNVIIDDNCLLDAKGADNQGITIGDGCFIGRNSILSCKDGDIALEDGVNVGFNCEIFSSSQVTIGRDTLIAAYCYMVGGGNYDLAQKDLSFAEQKGLDSHGGITIGPSVWLAAHAVILDGVTIGKGAVVAAGAMVRKDVPEATIVGGVPAKPIRTL